MTDEPEGPKPSTPDPDEADQPEVPEVVIPEPAEGDLIKIEFLVGHIEPVFAVRLRGRGISLRDVDLDIAGNFLSLLDRLIHGVAARLAGVTIPKRGPIPRPAGAARTRLGPLAYGQSVTLYFTMAPPEEPTLFGEHSDATEEATRLIIDLIGMDPTDDFVSRIQELGDRVAGEYVDLLGFLAERHLDTDWQVGRNEVRRVPASLAASARGRLRAEGPTRRSEIEVIGELFRADSRKNSFRLDTVEGESLAGTYSQDLEEAVRNAWARTVVARLAQTEYRWAYSTEPREIAYELLEIISIIE